MADKARQKDLFLAALLTQPTILQAATAAGLSETTAQRWLKEDAFKKAYAEARRRGLDEAMACLQHAMLGAVAVLRGVMLAPDTRPAQKIVAARTILELGLRTFEVEELEHRIAGL